MLITIVIVAFLLLGWELAFVLWPDDQGVQGFERACYAGLLALIAWLGLAWLTALLHFTLPVVLTVRTLLVGMVSVVLRIQRKPGGMELPVPISTALLVVAPMTVWLSYAFSRGAIVPPLSHDALAYHLPKAVLYARNHGYAYFDFLDPRIRNIPANYELLLAEFVAVGPGDTYTEWLSTLTYALFVIASAAMMQRWWKVPTGRAAGLTLFLAGIPVALLQSSAHKNDLMAAFFAVGALVAAGRFLAISDGRALSLAIAAFAAAAGTKPQGAIVAVAIAPFLAWRLLRPANSAARGGRTLVMAGAVAVVSFALLGGAVYVSNLIHSGALIGSGQHLTSGTVVVYGDWANLWQGPYVLLAAPFSPNPYSLWVPWAEQPWFWKRYEIYFSHLGVPFALCAMAAPFAAWLVRRRASTEVMAITIASIAALAAMLPVNFPPHGMYTISLPRYVLFIVPVVFGWTIAPLAASVTDSAWRGIVVVGLVAFMWYAVDNGVNDAFAPAEYVGWAAAHPGTRTAPFDPWRAAEVADGMAGPQDKIAIDAAFGTWIHPAFGAGLTRPVDFIPPGDGPPRIASDAKWVVVDRGWAVIWGAPRFRDLSQWRQLLMGGRPNPEDLRVIRALAGDRDFELLFYNPKTVQAVFRRVR